MKHDHCRQYQGLPAEIDEKKMKEYKIETKVHTFFDKRCWKSKILKTADFVRVGPLVFKTAEIRQIVSNQLIFEFRFETTYINIQSQRGIIKIKAANFISIFLSFFFILTKYDIFSYHHLCTMLKKNIWNFFLMTVPPPHHGLD